MSDAAGATPKKPKSKKKLLIIILAVVLLLALAGGGALFLMKKNAAVAADDEDGESSAEVAKEGKKHPPVIMQVPDNFTVNLADPGGDRFVQFTVNFEMEDEHASEELKKYMPSVRNAILLLVTQRTSQELLTLEGKKKLMADILVEASRPFGFGAEGDDDGKKKKKSKDVKSEANPVKAVNYGTFIIQ